MESFLRVLVASSSYADE